MPFAISSAPEVWQKTMHEVTEGLKGVEAIANNFIITGGKSREQNQPSFFTKCQEWNLKFKKDKVIQVQAYVPFTGHHPDPMKIVAITSLTEPENSNALKHFLGMVNYLPKFTPHMKGMTKLLPTIEDKDTEWQWLHQHSVAFNTVKTFSTKFPFLKNYNVNKEVTIQCVTPPKHVLGLFQCKMGSQCVLRQERSPTQRQDMPR